MRYALIAVLFFLLFAVDPGLAIDGPIDGAIGEAAAQTAGDQTVVEDETATERLNALCMLDSSSNPAYCACGARVSAEQLAPRDLEIMAFAMERTVWGGSEDIIGDARTAFGLSEEEVILAWRSIAAAGLKTSEACRHLR